MANSFKISAAYWDKLNEKEKYFMQCNAIQHGIAYCKRILTLANLFPEWSDIVCSNVYLQDLPSAVVSQYWIVFCGPHDIGIIEKKSCFGISERLHIKGLSGFHEVWNNWKTKNPNRSEKQEIAQSVMAHIA